MVSAQAANNRERSGVGRSRAVQMTLNAFCGERNWRERILDLVGHAARHFAPGCLLLGLEQIRKIFEYDHVAGAFRLVSQGRDSDGDIQDASRELNFHLAGGHAHAVAAAEQGLEILQDFGREERRPGRLRSEFRGRYRVRRRDGTFDAEPD